MSVSVEAPHHNAQRIVRLAQHSLVQSQPLLCHALLQCCFLEIAVPWQSSSRPTLHDKVLLDTWGAAAAAEAGGAAGKEPEAQRTQTQEVGCRPALQSIFRSLCVAYMIAPHGLPAICAK